MQYEQCTLTCLLCYGSLAKQFLVNVTDDLSSAIRRNIKPCPENCAVRMKMATVQPNNWNCDPREAIKRFIYSNTYSLKKMLLL